MGFFTEEADSSIATPKNLQSMVVDEDLFGH